jgi:hypothetical protein
MKKVCILGFASTLLMLVSVGARASVVENWNAVPAGTLAKQNGVYSTGNDFSGVDITVSPGNGATPFRFGPASLQTPAVTSTIFSGGQLGRNLSTVALFQPGSTITFTIDFFGFKQGVKDVSFDLFDVDMNTKAHGSVDVADAVSFKTAGLTLTGSKDNVVSGNTVTGIKSSNNTGPGSADGNVSVKSGSMPLHQIVFTYSALATENVSALAGIGIGDISFTPVPEVGQLAIGLAACLIGAVWLWRNRRERGPSIA